MPGVLMPPVALPLAELAPPSHLFLHDSAMHGTTHVVRVMILGCVLVEQTGRRVEAARLWASVYLHDLARTHDGQDRDHGVRAAARLANLPEVLDRFTRAGLGADDLAAVRFAVTHHVGRPESPMDHPLGPLVALLKDADGLDRVRLGDLDERQLRYDVSPRLVPFAERLLAASRALPDDTGLFPALFAAVPELLRDPASRR